MITLKDYLGTIVTGINRARAMADFESAAIARMYAEDDILKRFSVPRMTLDDVEFTIPIAIDALEMQSPRDYQPIDNKAFASMAYQELKNRYQVSTFDRKTSEVLRKMIYEETDKIEKEIKAGKSIDESLEQFSKSVSQVSKETIKRQAEPPLEKRKSSPLKKDVADPGQAEVANALKNILKKNIASRTVQSKIENAQITVESDKLMNKKPESLLYIKMKVSERGMVWETMENQAGETEARLLPE